MSYGNGLVSNVIEANQLTNTILDTDLNNTKINIVHVTLLNAVVTLPVTVDDYIIWVEDAVAGGGNITVNQAS